MCPHTVLPDLCSPVCIKIWCAPLSVNRPRKQHEVEAVCPVPLGFVEDRSLLHQVLQVSGIHLQPSDHVVHVALIVLVMNFTKEEGRKQTFTKASYKYVISFSELGCTHRLPDDFPQTVFYLLKVGSLFWILIPTAFYQHVHLRRQRTQSFKDISDNTHTSADKDAIQPALTHL